MLGGFSDKIVGAYTHHIFSSTWAIFKGILLVVSMMVTAQVDVKSGRV
jgi:hypothetical protein